MKNITSTHAYFKILNQNKEMEEFLNRDGASPPSFLYTPLLDSEKIARLINDNSENLFHQQSLKLALAGATLQHSNYNDTVEKFRHQNILMYGTPSKEQALQLLNYYRTMVNETTAHHWCYIQQHIPPLGLVGDNALTLKPKHATFTTYKNYFEKYTDHYFNKIGNNFENLPKLFDHTLRHTGLSDQGWSTIIKNNNYHAHINHNRKNITIGKHYNTRSPAGGKRIVAHEVYGHALPGFRGTIAHSEGFAILIEQLLSKRFIFRRSHRFLAAALGWGSLGEAMGFCEVYNVMWRLMVIVNKYSESDAKRSAFNECCRVFRGGRPDTPGAVYLKDSVYFQANVQIWAQLALTQHSYGEFVEIIEGKKNIL